MNKGWGEAVSLLLLLAGALMLWLFVWRQRRTRDPLIDLSLFASRSFTWGAMLATLVTFAIFGLLFVLPQFFQTVGGADTLTTGLRLLPMIGGLIVGAKAADRLLTAVGSRWTAAAGFAVMAAGLILGSLTGTESGYGFVAIWITVTGAGLGLALPTAMSSALNRLSAERSGVGSALIMAMRQVGGAIGVALLGSALNYSYRSRLDLAGVPGEAAETIKHGVSAGVAAARQIHSEALLANVQQAFVHGMQTMLWVCGGIAALSMILALLFLPGKKLSASAEIGKLEESI